MNYVQPIREKEHIEMIANHLKLQNVRNYMMFIVGINIGLRISDILTLKKKDVTGTHVVLREKKTKKRKSVMITPFLKRELHAYTKEMGPNEYLFQSRNGVNQPISRTTAYRILQQAAKHVRLRNIGTHTMRKTFGYHFYQRTKDVAMLQEIFGHSDPNITKRYIGINQDTMDKAMSKFNGLGDY